MPDAPVPDRRFFDLSSSLYDLPLVQRLTYRQIHEQVSRLLRATSPQRLLDVGCGTGLLAARVHREVPEVRAVGCDFSGGMLHHRLPANVVPLPVLTTARKETG